MVNLRVDVSERTNGSRRDIMNEPSPLLVLQARAEARAILYAAGELGDDAEAAVAPLLQYALEAGIADAIGAERAFAIVQTAFAGVAEP